MLIIIVLLGGGYYFVASRSNDAIPGDTYYTFDRVHEKVMRIFTTSDSKIGYDLELLEERIIELEALSQKETAFSDLLEGMNEIALQESNAANRIIDALAIDNTNTVYLENKQQLETFRTRSLDLMKELAERYNVSNKAYLKTSEEIAKQSEMSDVVDAYKSQLTPINVD
ncbi:hypothetical protein ACFL1U_02680 [Patescibacteria group bacterium]